jgi:hypothetical protein
MKIKPPVSKSGQWKDLTVEERRERRRLHREKQRGTNLGRAAKMHLARLKTKKEGRDGLSKLEGWFMSGVRLALLEMEGFILRRGAWGGLV